MIPTEPSRPRILIVDDNRALAENLVELFEELDVEVSIAGDAAQALATMDAQTDLAIVDVGLPDASGLELLDRLRAVSPDAEVILMTGQGTLESAIAAVRHGAYAYLLKPVDVDELLTLVERALAQVQLRAERTALARALASSEALYRGVVDHVEAWIVGVDAQGDICLLNRQAATGLTDAGLIGHTLDTEPGIAESVELLGASFVEALEAVKEGVPVGAFESSFGTEEPRIVRWQLTPVSEPRTAVQVLALGLDVTEQRALEKRNARAEAMAAIGVLTTGLAHEIRNPLNAAQLQLQLLDRRLGRLAVDDTERESLAGPVGLVRHELGRLSSLLDDFLGLARPSSLRPERVDLSELVTHVVQLAVPLCAEREVELRAHTEPELMAKVERGRIEQVLVNLVTNARDALDGPGTIEVRAERAADWIRLVVGDDGPGFPEESKGRLLQPFFTTKAAGTGLGLTIVRRIVEMHGGELRLGSSALGGAEVRIDLPPAR